MFNILIGLKFFKIKNCEERAKKKIFLPNSVFILNKADTIKLLLPKIIKQLTTHKVFWITDTPLPLILNGMFSNKPHAPLKS